MKLTYIKSLAALFTFSLALISCVKVSDDAIYLTRTLKLQATLDTSNSVKLEWNEPFIPNLNRYSIYRYTEKPPAVEWGEYCRYEQIGFETRLVCSDHHNLGSPMKTIYGSRQTSYIDENLPFAEKVYYRIAAEGDTTIISDVQVITFDDIEIIDRTAISSIIPENSNFLYFLQYKSYELTLFSYNFSTKSIADSIIFYPNGSEYFQSPKIKLGSINGKTAIYIMSGIYLMAIDASSMETIFSKELDNYPIRDVCSKDNFVFILSYYDIDVYNTTGTLIQNINTDYYNCLYLYNNQLLVTEDGSYADYIKYDINHNGSLTQQNTGNTRTTIFGGYFDESNGNLLSPDGKLYDYNLDFKETIFSNNPSFNNEIFVSKTLNEIYFTNSYDKKVYVYSLEGEGLLRTIKTRGIPITCGVNSTGELVVISQTGNFNNNVLIERF